MSERNGLILGMVLVLVLVAIAGLTLYIRGDASRNYATAALKYEQITYQYPKNWKLYDSSRALPRSRHYCSYPGEGIVTLVSPSQSQVTLYGGQVCPTPFESKTFEAVPITSFGRQMYLAFEAPLGLVKSAPTLPTTACLSLTPNPTSTFEIKSKNIHVDNTVDPGAIAYDAFCYAPYHKNTGPGVLPTFTVQQIENSPDYTTAKHILESLRYS